MNTTLIIAFIFVVLVLAIMSTTATISFIRISRRYDKLEELVILDGSFIKTLETNYNLLNATIENIDIRLRGIETDKTAGTISDSELLDKYSRNDIVMLKDAKTIKKQNRKKKK